MRILLIHNFYKHYGGEDNVVENQLRLLKQYGNHVYCCFEHSKAINAKNVFGLFLNSYCPKHTLKRIKSIVHDFKPEIAHIHNVYPIISPGVYSILSEFAVPIVQTLHNYRFICPNGLMFVNGRVCEKCYQKHGYYNCVLGKCYRNSYIQSMWYADVISRAYRKGCFDKISRFIALTRFTKEKMTEKGFRGEKIEVLPNFTDLPEKPPVYHKDNYILYMGRLAEEKGIFTLIKAVEEISTIKLKIAGHGDLIWKVRDYIVSKGINNVELLGFISGVDKERLISRAKAVIVPSECYENFPNVILEAFSRGTTVIASEIGGMKYIIDKDFNGLKYKAGDATDLREKLNYILNNSDVLLKMSINAYETYLERYTPEKYYTELMKLYSEVISESKGEITGAEN